MTQETSEVYQTLRFSVEHPLPGIAYAGSTPGNVQSVQLGGPRIRVEAEAFDAEGKLMVVNRLELAFYLRRLEQTDIADQYALAFKQVNRTILHSGRGRYGDSCVVTVCVGYPGDPSSTMPARLEVVCYYQEAKLDEHGRVVTA